MKKKKLIFFHKRGKDTQGNTKLDQYLEDLLRNNIFYDKIEELNAEWTRSGLTNANMLSVSLEQLKGFSEHFDKINNKIFKKRLRYITLLNELAEEYGLEDVFFLPKLTQNKNQALLKRFLKERLEMCQITDEYAKNLDKDFPPVPFQFDIKKQTHIRVFPISIAIHKFASKRDILDYIENNWEKIESHLRRYQEKSVRIRRRSLNRKLADYIWKNRLLKRVEIEMKIKEHFPGVSLKYFEINKIISLEKKRREEKITVGH